MGSWVIFSILTLWFLLIQILNFLLFIFLFSFRLYFHLYLLRSWIMRISTFYFSIFIWMLYCRNVLFGRFSSLFIIIIFNISNLMDWNWWYNIQIAIKFIFICFLCLFFLLYFLNFIQNLHLFLILWGLLSLFYWCLYFYFCFIIFWLCFCSLFVLFCQFINIMNVLVNKNKIFYRIRSKISFFIYPSFPFI